MAVSRALDPGSKGHAMAWFCRRAPLLLLTATFAAGCGPDAATTDNPGPRPGGSGGSATTGGSTGTGTGGSTGTGTGGSTGAGTGGSGGATGGSGAAPGGGLALPMVVTTNFDNQGWFADPELEKAFQPGSMVIRQADGTTGPCATRMSQARGKCLKISYTPPAGLMPPATGGWVGVFFLTTVLTDRPTAAPPVKVGDANWGSSGEPGRNIAAGATKITFLAASDVAGQAVTFKAGTASDSFVVADKPEVLGTSWQSYSLPLTGSYGTNVFGAFAWVLTDTTKPATFYLDNIVWEQ
jgi:hypothetical protein